MRKTILIVTVGLLSSSMFANVSLDRNVTAVNKEAKMINSFEINSFCKAIIQGDLEMVSKMIALGEDVNQKSLGKTPAHYAARYNKAEILELLIQNGANLKKRCDQGYTVMKFAELSDSKEAMQVIEAAMKK